MAVRLCLYIVCITGAVLFLKSGYSTQFSLNVKPAFSLIVCAARCFKSKRLYFEKHTQTCECSNQTYYDRTDAIDHKEPPCYKHTEDISKSGLGIRRYRFVKCSPEDTPITCIRPDILTRASSSYESLVAGSTVRYACDSGFSFCEGPEKTLTCLDNGEWENLNGVCVQDTWVNPSDQWNQNLTCVLKEGSALEFTGIPVSTQINQFIVMPMNKGKLLYMIGVNVMKMIKATTEIICTNPVNGKLDNSAETKTVVYERFNITIVIQNDGFQILMDGAEVVVCQHLTPFSQVDQLMFDRSQLPELEYFRIRP